MKNDFDLITTIITTYKRPFFLKRAIESILAQSFPHFQLFVLDNCSEDETEKLVESFRKKDLRIHYICHQTNIGMMKNYEFGFGLIKSPYFHFLSDDDTLAPSFFEDAIKMFEAYPDLGFYAGSTHILSLQGKFLRAPLQDWKREGYWSPLLGTKEMFGKSPVPAGVIFSSSILQKIKPDLSNILYWDLDFLLQVSLYFPFYISKKFSASFMSHPQGFSHHPNFTYCYDAYLKMKNRLNSQSLYLKAKQTLLHLLDKDFKLHFRGSLVQLFTEKKISELKQAKLSLEKEYPFSFLFSCLFFAAKRFPIAARVIPFFKKTKKHLIEIKQICKYPLTFSPKKKKNL